VTSATRPYKPWHRYKIPDLHQQPTSILAEMPRPDIPFAPPRFSLSYRDFLGKRVRSSRDSDVTEPATEPVPRRSGRKRKSPSFGDFVDSSSIEYHTGVGPAQKKVSNNFFTSSPIEPIQPSRKTETTHSTAHPPDPQATFTP